MHEFNLQDEIHALQNDPYVIPNEVDPSDGNVGRALEKAVEAVAENIENVGDEETWDSLRSFLKHSEHLNGAQLSKLLDSISSGLQSTIDQLSHVIEGEDPSSFLPFKPTLERFAFLLQWFVTVAERAAATAPGDAASLAKPKGRGAAKKKADGKKRGEWSWDTQIAPTLTLMAKTLKLRTHRLWSTSAERDAFVNCFTRPAYQIAQSETYMKNQDIRLAVYKVICLAVKQHAQGFSAQTSIMQNLQYFEHLSEPMAEVLAVLAKDFDHAQLSEEILREIAAKSFSAQDTKGPRSFGRFLTRITELLPRIVLKQISLLLTHLDSESYPMRMSIIEILGTLIKELSLSEEGEQDAREKQIEKLFELLNERFMDLNSWVRAKVITTLTKLCDLPTKFPKQRQQITELTIAALEDKSSSVRRYAIALITRLILTHPFGLLHGGPLNLAAWEDRYKKVKDELDALEKKMGVLEGQRDVGEDEVEEDKAEGEREDDDADENEVEEDAGEDDEEREMDEVEPTPKKPKRSKKSKARAPRQSEPLNLAAVSEEQALAAMDGSMMIKLRLTKRYYADALRFIRIIEHSMDLLSTLLVSTNKAEVLEAMEFFRVAHEYEFVSAQIGIKKMVHLIWTKDNNVVSEDGKELKGIRARLLEVYRNLYFDAPPDQDSKHVVNRIAKNLIELTYSATLAELTSLEELLRTMMDDGQIQMDIVQKLWDVYGTEREIPRQQRRGAIMILGMLAVAKREVVTERVETLLRIGLGSFGKADLNLARFSCIALQRVSGSAKKVKGSLVDKTMRLPMDNAIFRKLEEAIEWPCASAAWFGMAEQAINTIYLLGEQPDTLCQEMVKSLTRKAFAPLPEDRSPRPQKEVPTQPGVPPTPGFNLLDDNEVTATSIAMNTPGSTTSNDIGDAFALSQLVFVVGHVAIKHIVYLELVERELKRRKDEAAKDKKAKTKGSAKEGEELEQVAGNAEDDIGDIVSGVRERELLYGPASLLALYGPMLKEICGTPRVYKNVYLRRAATIALSKFMCVSSLYCEDNLLLLFKIMETSRDPTMRSNIVIALGDVAISFSNMIDENSNRLYDGLADQDLTVKKNTLMVLTHLILNGMIKVKGQLGEMAKCLEDEETRIADLAKLFFSELASKDNAVYNNLPDVISHLSTGEHAVDEETFQRTMKYIFSFIEKEKQAENIVEKLCQRFRLAKDERQWRDIAFCMSMLPFKSERSMKKLIEGLPFYQDKLHEETVFKRFNEILSKARSNKQATKPDTELKEFEQILLDFKAKGEEDHQFQEQVGHHAEKVKKRAVKREHPANESLVSVNPWLSRASASGA
ncbi:hypothetical protein DACRYDRAFT_94650 [Dacryopinax primogenitus]|uniref:Condensin complex subunit 1 n=1 Tax=Dacryopinax primogenitus (strain DJM 731) TaxID=1858805 RepID=M5FWG9_DACPD|nr:uncharacterized protein DACRYDRAFT_94650 [Dacryopinax primogenitus]EJU02276.1 hypothetical protein DACRYDRAFT_94650 [Dacryopinax primogenitus]